ncbi:MAG: helix-turn-helix transcriptional regulator [Candidatus Woesearchaeota archaeon]
MKKDQFWTGFFLALLSFIALVSVLIAILTYTHNHVLQSWPVLSFLVQYHLWIMLFSIFIALMYGFTISFVLQRRVRQEQLVSKKLLEIILLFLNTDERRVITHLLEHKGHSTQASIARIEGMGGVKALRTVQKMKEKSLVRITKEGKVRHVHLKKQIATLLSQ